MATRGFVGFVVDQQEKITYNHHDSFPAGVGLDILTWLRAAVRTLDEMRQRVAALRVVSDSTKPTVDDIERLRRYADTCTDPTQIEDWWQLLWQTYGNPAAILDAGVIWDASYFPATSTHCEWGYMIDLDVKVFEVYRGQQSEPHQRGRFAPVPEPSQAYPAALVMGWPLGQLPSDDEFLAALTLTE
ncbi:hypothetical protein [Nonomuraea sp. NPDC023979]|uniref:hypothetical protein n=1 Tax=Nonomuraea sp. NPDC023979 TaxID=3154796 RepID=UPI0033E4092E